MRQVSVAWRERVSHESDALLKSAIEGANEVEQSDQNCGEEAEGHPIKDVLWFEPGGRHARERGVGDKSGGLRMAGRSAESQGGK